MRLITAWVPQTACGFVLLLADVQLQFEFTSWYSSMKQSDRALFPISL